MTPAASAPAAHYVLAVCRRQILVWRRLFVSSLMTNVLEPTLILFAFGFGLGAVVKTMGGVPYIAFVVPGMMVYSAMFAASFETTIGSFSRYYLQKTWDAALASPVTLTELLLGEALWAALKATIAAFCVLLVGGLWGGVLSVPGALLALPIAFLAGLTFAACGLVATALAKDYTFFSYFFTLWVTPSFVFSGVFFEIDRFPAYVRAVSQLLPTTHLIDVVRPLVAGLPLSPLAALGHLAVVVLYGVGAFLFARARLRRRMFD